MRFDDVIENVINELTPIFNLPKDKLRSLLIKKMDKKSQDFAIFLNSISENPKEFAIEVVEKLKDLKYIINPKALNTCVSFDLNKNIIFGEIFNTILTKKDNFGSSEIGKGKKFMVEFSSPNIAKKFHIGHFRTTNLGHFICSLLKFNGFDVTSINYLGDWGKQFGLLLYGYQNYGSEEELKKDALKHLYELYVKTTQLASTDHKVDEEARSIFKSMEEGNEKSEYRSLFNKFRDLSIKKFKESYKKLDIEFDIYSGESFYAMKGKEIISKHKDKLIDEDGALLVDLGKKGKALLQKTDGSTLYITRDIAAGIERLEEYNPDKILYVVASEQKDHFSNLYEILGKLGYNKNVFQHVDYGLVRKMSTREGTAVFLDDIINLSTKVMKDEINSDQEKASKIKDIDETSRILAVSTLIVMDFKAKRCKDYEFNIAAHTTSASGTGSYLQYAHCRLVSIKEVNSDLFVDQNNNIIDNLSNMKLVDSIDFDMVKNDKICNLAYKLLWFEYVVENCLKDYEPSKIITYLMDLASTSNNIVDSLRVKGESNKDIARARLLVLESIRIVIHNGLKLIGIQPLEKM